MKMVLVADDPCPTCVWPEFESVKLGAPTVSANVVEAGFAFVAVPLTVTV